jgi:hypothetical protein
LTHVSHISPPASAACAKGNGGARHHAAHTEKPKT